MRFLNLLYLSIGKSDRTLKFFRQNIIVIELYIALVQKKKSAPLRKLINNIILELSSIYNDALCKSYARLLVFNVTHPLTSMDSPILLPS